MASSLVNSVIHWRKKLERNTDEDVVLNVIHKLSKVPMTVDLLQETGIGKTIRLLAKKDGKVGSKASTVLSNWRGVLLSNNKNPEDVKHKSKNDNVKDKKSEKSSKNSLSESSPVKIKDASSKHHHVHSNGVSKPVVKSDKKEQTHHVNGFATQKIVKENGCEKKMKESTPELKRKITEVSSPENGIKMKKHKTENGVQLNSSHDLLKKKSHKNDSQVVNNESSSKTHSHKHSKKSSDTESPKKSKKHKEAEDSKAGLKAGATEAFTASEALFEDCLNFSDAVKKKKKKSSKASTEKKVKEKSVKENSGEKHKSKSSTSSASSSKSSLKSSSKSSLKPSREKSTLPTPLTEPSRTAFPKITEVDILSTLPQPQPNYRPLPPRHDESHDTHAKRKVLSNEDAIKFTSSRRERTNVYSGRKTGFFYTEVPSLFDSCIRILIDNIKAIEYMGGAPYFLLKPVLERCTPIQLENIEHFNPNLLDDTHELWELHSKRDFRNLEPGENETWRELYWRAHEDRERRLRRLTKNISENISKTGPGRLVKLAYVDSVVKPPRDVARKQAKNGTALPVNHPIKPGPASRATPRPTAPAINAASTSSGREFVPKSKLNSKPKVAPLMAKTLKSMKQCFRR